MASREVHTAPRPKPVATAFVEVRPDPNPDKWTARVQIPGGDGGALHSRRDPLAEARTQLAVVDVASASVIVLVGAGLGFVTKAARQRWPNARVVVVEPVPQLAKAASQRVPALYESDSVHVVVGPDYEGAENLRRLFDTPDADRSGPAVIVHPVLARVMPAEMANAVSLVRQAIGAAQMNARAREDNAGRYLLNTLRNIPRIANSANPDHLTDQFTGVPAVIVGAGPSLDRQLPTLSALGDRALIVATDTAWRPLGSAGIDPHLVVSLDPTPANGRHLTRVPSRRETWVLAEGSVDPAALLAVRHLATFRVGDHHPWPWLLQLGVERPVVRAWGSVWTSAFDLTLTLGCDPIILVGADLAYTHGQPYCRGTTFEHEWARYTAVGCSVREIWEQTLSVRTLLAKASMSGEDVLTAPHLVEFRDWLLARAREAHGRCVVNATGAGILHGPGVEVCDLEVVLKDEPVRDPAVREAVAALLSRRPDVLRVDSGIDGLAAMLEEAIADGEVTGAVPVGDWLDFGRPSLTLVADVRESVAAALDSLRTSRLDPKQARIDAAPTACRADRVQSETQPSRFYEADRVALMRALLTGDRTKLEGSAMEAARNTAPAGKVENATKRALRAVDRLLKMHQLTDASDPDCAAGSNIHLVPLSCRFTWAADAAPMAALLEELVLEAAFDVWTEAVDDQDREDFWAGSIEPVVDGVDVDSAPAGEQASPDRSLDQELAERTTLTACRHALDAFRSWDPVVTSDRRLQRILLVIMRGVVDHRLHAPVDAVYGLEVIERQGSDRSKRLPLRIDTLTRAITGILAVPDDRMPESIGTTDRVWPELRVAPVQHATPTEPRQLFLSNDIAYVEPEVLTGRGLSRGASLATDGDSCAVFTPWPSRQSVRISSVGRIEDGSSWPYSITGYVPWGDDGGALAWNRDDSVILFRARTGTDPVVSRVPFQPALVAPRNDGAVFWYGAGGGLWEWLPGGSGRFLVATPESCALRLDGQELVLAPIVRDSHGHVTRRRFVHEWRYDPSGGGCRETAAGLEGQCASVAERGGWTARTYPFSDLVRLDLADVPRVRLACYSPFGAAWAGPSLLVATPTGVVLLFRDLTDRLKEVGIS